MNPLRWVRSLLAQRRMQRDLAEEIALHLEEKIDALMATGLDRAEATAAARRAFGNVTAIREESRDVWGLRAFHDFSSDVRYGFRQLRRAPSFAAAAILTLAVGIGANTAIFSIVHAVVFRALPFHDPATLVSVESISVRGTPHRESLSYFTFFEFRRAGVFDRIASYRSSGVTLTGRDLPVPLSAQVVSSDLFDVLGVPMRLGRGFLPTEEIPGVRVIVVSYETWQSHLGGDDGIIGRPIVIDGEPATVVGVTPAGFSFPVGRRVQAWMTLAGDASAPKAQPITEQRGARLLNAVARLAPGTTLEQAGAALDVVAARLAKEYPDSHKNLPRTHVEPEATRVAGDAREPMLMLWGAVAMVLLIACANIANMLLARTADRQHELGVRLAIGGSRRRIIRQLLTENLMIAVAGAAIGAAGAVALVRLLTPLVGDAVPRFGDAGVNASVLIFTIGLALGVTVLVSVPPALWIARAGLGRAVRSESRSATGMQERVRGALVVAQVSIGVMLMCMASVLAAGFLQLMQRDLGFNPDRLFAFRIELPGARYSTTRQIAFIDQLLEDLKRVPGVVDATVGMPLPVTGNEMALGFDIEERPASASERPMSNMAIVGSDYFRTIGTPIIDGRAFVPSDDEAHERVMVVNKAFAARFFPGESAIGKRIVSGATSDRDPKGTRVFRTIVGIVGNARQGLLGREPETIYYLPYKQVPWGPPSVIVRTSLEPSSVVPDLRRVVAALDRQVPLHDITTLDALVARGMAAPRFLSLLMGSFAGIGLLLTATGLYGLLSYAVSRRTREIGVRIALGASRRSIVDMILGRAFVLIMTGTVIGGAGLIVGQLLLTRATVALDVPHPVAWLCGAAVTVILTAIAAAYVPAARAAAIDPTSALRAE